MSCPALTAAGCARTLRLRGIIVVMLTIMVMGA